MSIYECINKIMAELPAIPKSRTLEVNGRKMYDFRGIDDLYFALQPLLIKYGVTSVPEASLVHQEQIQTTKEYKGEVKTLITHRVVLGVDYHFYAKDGTCVQARVIGEGMDTGDKACNKAMSAAHKYALLQVFCIPTAEQKDSEYEHHEAEKKSSNSSLTQKAQASSSHKVEMPTSGISELGDYVVTFGKFKDRTIADIAENEGPQKVSSYIGWLESDAKVKKKPMTQAAKDFIEAFDAHIGSSELDKALDRPKDKTVTDQLERLKNQYPAPQYAPQADLPRGGLPYSDDPWPDNE